MRLSTAADLYESDYYRWTKAQAAELRRMWRDRINTALDLERLAEEVDGLGRSERDACRSQVRRILEHFLKLDHSRLTDPRGGWRASIAEARQALGDKLTPTLRRDLQRHLPSLFRGARQRVVLAFEEYGLPHAPGSVPEACPYTLAQILDEDWFPAEPTASGPAARRGSRRSRA
jgi:hypothetical protein